MIFTYFVAAVVATILAAVNGPEFPRLHYWRRWDPGPLRLAITFIWFTYAATGVAVTALATQLDWKVLDAGAGSVVANGAAYGAAAATLLRLEVTSFGLAPISPARTIYTSTLERASRWLQAGADRRVPRVVGDLRPRQLCRGSWRLALRYHVPGLAVEAAVMHLENLRLLHAAAVEREHGSAVWTMEAERAQETLRFYIEELIIDRGDATIEFGEDDQAQV